MLHLHKNYKLLILPFPYSSLLWPPLPSFPACIMYSIINYYCSLAHTFKSLAHPGFTYLLGKNPNVRQPAPHLYLAHSRYTINIYWTNEILKNCFFVENKYSPTLKRNKLLLTATSWLDLTGIMMSEKKWPDYRDGHKMGRWGKGWVWLKE